MANDPKDDSTQNTPVARTAMTDVPGAVAPPKATEHDEEGTPIKFVRYIGNQLSIVTNLGNFVYGEVKGVHASDTSQDDARTLIANGQFEDAGDDAEVGVTEEQQKANALEAQKRERDLAEQRNKSAVAATPLTPAQIQANADAQVKADQAKKDADEKTSKAKNK